MLDECDQLVDELLFITNERLAQTFACKIWRRGPLAKKPGRRSSALAVASVAIPSPFQTFRLQHVLSVRCSLPRSQTRDRDHFLLP